MRNPENRPSYELLEAYSVKGYVILLNPFLPEIREQCFPTCFQPKQVKRLPRLDRREARGFKNPDMSHSGSVLILLSLASDEAHAEAITRQLLAEPGS